MEVPKNGSSNGEASISTETFTNGNMKRPLTLSQDDSSTPSTSNEAKRQALTFHEIRERLNKAPQIESLFQKQGKEFVLNMLKALDLRLQSKRIPLTRLAQYQIEAVLAVHDHFAKNEVIAEKDFQKAALIIAPPGSGKSGMATLIPYVLQSRKVLVLTPSKIITEQLAAEFGNPNWKDSFFFKCGMYSEPVDVKKLIEKAQTAVTQKEIDNLSASNLVIVNAQKFGGNSGVSVSPATKTEEQIKRVKDQLNEFDTIIVDEAHHYPAQTWVNVVERFWGQGKKIILLTATPFNGEGRMTDKFQQLIEPVYMIERTELQGKTIRPIQFIENEAVDDELGSSEFIDQLRNDITGILAEHDQREPRIKSSYGEPKSHQAIILVRTKEEATLVADKLGDMATYVTSDKGGQQNLDDFKEQLKTVVVVCGMLREGYDNPFVSLVVILRKCQSRVLFEQFCGRCMRMNRDLTGPEPDRVTGTVLTYRHFQQSKMWAKMHEVAEEDPSDETEDDNGIPQRVSNIIPL